MTQKVDYGPLFGGVSSSGLLDKDQVGPHLMDRVEVEPQTLSVLSPDTGVDVVTRRLLLEALRKHGSRVIAAAPLELAPELAARDRPTALLWGLRFAVGHDDVEVVVQRRKKKDRPPAVRIRTSPKERSLCGPHAKVGLDYIELIATVQRAEDRSLVAAWHELGAVDLHHDAVREIELPGVGGRGAARGGGRGAARGRGTWGGALAAGRLGRGAWGGVLGAGRRETYGQDVGSSPQQAVSFDRKYSDDETCVRCDMENERYLLDVCTSSR